VSFFAAGGAIKLSFSFIFLSGVLDTAQIFLLSCGGN